MYTKYRLEFAFFAFFIKKQTNSKLDLVCSGLGLGCEVVLDLVLDLVMIFCIGFLCLNASIMNERKRISTFDV